MPNKEEPIYDFNRLKEFLISKGFVVGSREPYEVVTPEEVTPEELRKGNIRFDSNGIFVKDRNGYERQVFLYKRDYHLSWYGSPKFHICKCGVIEDFINSGGFNDHYMRTNSEPVKVIDLDDGRKEKDVEGMFLCGFCRRIISQYGNINSTEFVRILKEANGETEEKKDIEVDLFGYTRDWDEIKTAYKEKKQYTCEKCGLKIDDAFDRQYIHCHHIDRVKTNNSESNLKCLCLYCHAHVDERHLKRLTTGANKYTYDDFIEKYGER